MDNKWLTEMADPAVPAERKQENARYIVHTVKLKSLPKIDRTNAVQVRDRTVEFLKACVDDGIKPNLTGYALSLGTDRRGLESLFSSRSVDKATQDELDAGVAMIENIMLELMMDQKINPVTAIFLLKNHFAYSDQTDLRIRAERVETVDEQALEDKYRNVIDMESYAGIEGEDRETVESLKRNISEHYTLPE